MGRDVNLKSKGDVLVAWAYQYQEFLINTIRKEFKRCNTTFCEDDVEDCFINGISKVSRYGAKNYDSDKSKVATYVTTIIRNEANRDATRINTSNSRNRSIITVHADEEKSRSRESHDAELLSVSIRIALESMTQTEKRFCQLISAGHTLLEIGKILDVTQRGVSSLHSSCSAKIKAAINED